METDMEGTTAYGFEKQAVWQHHTLNLQFPACGLLPLGKRPFIERPNRMADREEPEFTPLGLNANDLATFVRFKIDSGVDTDDARIRDKNTQLPKLAEPLNLAACIHYLSTFAGVSDLQFVSYIEDDDVLTRFKLTTRFFTDAGQLVEPVREYELGSAEINMLIKNLVGKEEWVKRMTDLIHANSDRAYLFRKSLLLEFDEEWTQHLEASWGVEWDETPFKSIRQLFADRLLSIYVTDDGKMATEPFGELMENHDELLRVQLPCGHRVLYHANYIRESPLKDLLRAVCDVCGERIMSRADYATLRMFFARRKRYDWEDNMEPWFGKHRTVRNDTRLVELRSEDLIESLLQAQVSFAMPSTMNPRALCPTTQPESRALLLELVEALRPHVTLPAMTPKQLFKNLEDLAWKRLRDSFGGETYQLMYMALPPGFERFVHKWLTRAVNHAVGNQTDGKTDEDLMEVVEKMERTRIDPKAAAVESGLNDILRQMGETRLEEGFEGEGERGLGGE